MIYFIEANTGVTSYVKIGFSRSPLQRLAELQTGCPILLRLMFTIFGDETTESNLHRRFSEYAVRGEWFLNDGGLRTYVERQLWLNPSDEKTGIDNLV